MLVWACREFGEMSLADVPEYLQQPAMEITTAQHFRHTASQQSINDAFELYAKRQACALMNQTDASEEYEYYIIHDSLGVSHVMRHKKGVLPAIRCTDCD